MAKKKSSRGEFNMSAEIRTLLQENKNMSSRDVYEELQKRNPGQEINRNSCNVAFSQARRKLGIRPKSKRAVRHAKPGVRIIGAGARRDDAVNIALLRSARKFLAEAGNAQAAISAIQQLDSLQIN